MFDLALTASSLHAPVQHDDAAPRLSTPSGVWRPCHIDSKLIARVLGRCGRVTDTADPERYAKIFKRLWNKFGLRFRYGFMVPANLLLEGALRHPTYHEKRVPQMAPLVLLKDSKRFGRRQRFSGSGGSRRTWIS